MLIFDWHQRNGGKIINVLGLKTTNFDVDIYKKYNNIE